MFQSRSPFSPTPTASMVRPSAASRNDAISPASFGAVDALGADVPGYGDVPLSSRRPGGSGWHARGLRGNASSFDIPAKAISAGGSGTIANRYTPEASDKSTKIVFIQVMRESLDGAAAKPSASDPSFAYQDSDTTSDMYHVDYVSGEKDPYYNGDDANDFGAQGNAAAKPPVAASTTDTPRYPDATFPVGTSTLLYEFRTAAFSAAGSDAGTYYGYADWTYAKPKGSPDATAIVGTKAGDPGSNFKDAVALFCSNHGFTLPPGGGLGRGTSALIGAGIGGAVGAALGAFGGPVGALVGGLIGAGVGAIAGAIAG
ncbi:MAG: hypothetical protein HY067_15450 [Betaproteobacteria bacterium]|nr:hypothetical protein [Betaproteobacteria bacterium]